VNRYPFATPLLTRRALLLASPAGVLHSASASDIRRELFRSSPAPGVAVMAYAFYTRPQGGDMISIEERWSRSDTVDVAYMRHSRDHGQNWTPAVEIRTGEARSGGMLRRHPRCGFVEPGGRYVEFWNEGVLPSDDPLEGMRQWNIYYRVSRDGGRQFTPVRQVIHTGSEFDSRHPLPGVWTGKNCVMLGDVSCAPLVLPDGRILLPVQITPLAPDGSLFNPGGGSTYTDAVVLIGRWRGDQLEWEMSAAIQGDPARSTRGMDEGTLGILDDGRILTVLRGSNSGRMAIPGYRWFALSDDGGRHWSKPQPWTYADGEPFFSPASARNCSITRRDACIGLAMWCRRIHAETGPAIRS